MDLSRTRNIGIIAHIDAGKTTTTERMLYYSGHTRRIGDVDEGSTVTDFLPAERARGITIQSAAITFNWPPKDDVTNAGSSPSQKHVPHNINLIDTPGHADFTFEVLRSLRVLDGAICILDGVAGVEAQTEKVWSQANLYDIPRVIYVNKMDREGASFARTVKEAAARLHAQPAVCSIPWWRQGDRKLCGTADAVNLCGLLWTEGSDGRVVETISLEHLSSRNPDFAQELRKARIALIETLSEYDDQLVESFFEHEENHLAIPAEEIIASLRRCVISSKQAVFPVFAGASFRNLGVQPLLDAVNAYLPSPDERPDPLVRIDDVQATLGNLLTGNLPTEIIESQRIARAKSRRSGQASNIKAVAQGLTSCALAFKVVNDPKKGILVYVRVYSGRLERGATLFNTNLKQSERVPRVLKMYASDAVEIPYIEAGQIGVLAGLKLARTGDTLITYNGPASRQGPPAPIDTLQLRPIDVPPPVFWVSVEPNSLSEEKHINETLDILLREDPSLQINSDPESGQRHLAGMGELHLEIARDRLLKDFKAKAFVGKVEISYREAIQADSASEEMQIQREFAGKTAHAGCSVSLKPATGLDEGVHLDDNTFEVSLTNENKATVRLIPPEYPDGTNEQYAAEALPAHLPLDSLLSAARNGASAGLARGIQYGFPLSSTIVEVRIDIAKHVFPDTTPAAISSAIREGVMKTLKQTTKDNGSALLEPVMMVKINMNESDLGSVVQDLSSTRGGQVLSLDSDESVSETDPTQDQAIDLSRVYVPPDPFSSNADDNSSALQADVTRQVTARVPLREMVGYLKHLRSMTGGRGTFVMQVDRFEKVTGPRLKSILTEMRGV